MGNKMGSCLAQCTKKEEANFTPKTHLSDLKIQLERDGSPYFVCEICVESKPLHESLKVKGCSHFYCTLCLIRYIASKIEDNITSISCPELNCGAMLEYEDCRLILPDEDHAVFSKWGDALCESAIAGYKKLYCPYKNCSALLTDEREAGCKQSKFLCPSCKRLFCVRCKVPWHEEFECAEFKKLWRHGEEALVLNLAKIKNWKKCPNCKCLVERLDGCYLMKCRCGASFCYECGQSCGQSFDHHECDCVQDPKFTLRDIFYNFTRLCGYRWSR